jgi:hypothetical protein
MAPANPPTPVTPGRPATGKPASGRALNVLLGLAAAVAIGGVAFTIGRSTAPVAAATGAFGPGGFGNGNGLPGASFAPGASGFPGGPGGFNRGGGLTVTGTVESIDGDTITIRTADGSTMTITTDSATTYHESTVAAAGDVTPGASISVRLGGDGAGGPGASGVPSLTATDVTVDR